MKKLMLLGLLLIASIGYSQTWGTSIEDAKDQAVKENKNILLVFSGSDWCGPCIKLDKNVWQSEIFKIKCKKWVLVKADFPKKKANQLAPELTESNNQLAEKYNKEGNFPLVLMLSKTGKVIGATGYANVEAMDYLEILYALEKNEK
jgi:thioredoxin-related protein